MSSATASSSRPVRELGGLTAVQALAITGGAMAVDLAALAEQD